MIEKNRIVAGIFWYEDSKIIFGKNIVFAKIENGVKLHAAEIWKRGTAIKQKHKIQH